MYAERGLALKTGLQPKIFSARPERCLDCGHKRAEFSQKSGKKHEYDGLVTIRSAKDAACSEWQPKLHDIQAFEEADQPSASFTAEINSSSSGVTRVAKAFTGTPSLLRRIL